MNSRRGFLRMLGISPIVGAASVLAFEDRSNDAPEHDEPILILNPDKNHKCQMSAGKDNNLWIKFGNTWKRVVTE